jgi:hypothetical protein
VAIVSISKEQVKEFTCFFLQPNQGGVMASGPNTRHIVISRSQDAAGQFFLLLVVILCSLSTVSGDMIDC